MTFFIEAGIIAIIFLVGKLIESRIGSSDKDTDKSGSSKPIKYIFRDALMVFLSVLLGNFLIEQLKPMLPKQNIHPMVFVGTPEF